MTTERPTLDDELERHGAQAVDLRFTDLLGGWRHLTLDRGTVKGGRLARATLIDGSAVPGWRDAAESDLLLLPDPSRTWLDPFAPLPTLLCVADVVDPASTEGYERCPRSALLRVLDEVRHRGIADDVEVSVDLAFYVFDELRVQQGPGTLGFAAAHAGGREVMGSVASAYLEGQPIDRLADLRGEMVATLARLGFDGLVHGSIQGPGQCEIKFGPADLLLAADQIQLARYVIASVARAYGKVASFLPAPLSRAPGSGLHLHVAMRRHGQSLFAGQGYADLSDTCLHAIGGVLRHAAVLNAFTNASTNSYRRLRLGRAEPSLLGFGARNRATAVRIPAASRPEDKRIELRFPDPLANPYLALGAIVLAMADGITTAADPGEPIDRNTYDLAEDPTGLDRCALDLPGALNALAAARSGLFGARAMPPELIDAYLALKTQELDLLASAPHPLEHALYGA